MEVLLDQVQCEGNKSLIGSFRWDGSSRQDHESEKYIIRGCNCDSVRKKKTHYLLDSSLRRFRSRLAAEAMCSVRVLWTEFKSFRKSCIAWVWGVAMMDRRPESERGGR